MTTDLIRLTYIDHLRQVYGLGVKDSENTIAAYDHYFNVMEPGLSLARLIQDVWERKPVVRIMDLGCGDAGMLRELLRKHVGKIDPHGVDQVAPKVGKKGLQFHEGDALTVQFPSDCDLIVSFRAMHEIGALHELIPKVAQALAIGGKAFLSIRIAEWEGEKLAFQGSITKQDLEWLRDVADVGMLGTVVITCASVTGQMPGRRDQTFVRGVNVFLERV